LLARESKKVRTCWMLPAVPGCLRDMRMRDQAGLAALLV